MFVIAVILKDNQEIKRVQLPVSGDGVDISALQDEMNRIRREGMEVFDRVTATFISSLE